MEASIDFWLEELDTQITEMSPAVLGAIRSGIDPSASRARRPVETSRAPHSSRGADLDRATTTVLERPVLV